MPRFTEIPSHLKKYVERQDSSSYTSVEHSTWRFIMRQLKDFLSVNAHPFYLDGVKKSGVEIEKIPSIQDISKKLEQFGWRTIPVSGFLPPAAFMELQALGYLPIAKEMRNVQHIPYTPAPDIVHEAAGHAPFLAHPDFAAYLHNYAQVSSKCILSGEDFAVYQAIRELSDLKESHSASMEQIAKAEVQLETAIKNISYVSEATKVSRLYWWTSEYGLIGDLNNPKIYGAGLLSSIGESTECLNPKVKKLPLSLDCINYTYDITEKQPQLFVARDFQHLNEVLFEMVESFSFKVGGLSGMTEAAKSKTVNTVQLSSGLQISGVLKNFETFNDQPSYMQFSSPTQLSFKDKEIRGHGIAYHSQGFGSPIGKLKGQDKCLNQFVGDDLLKAGIQIAMPTRLEFESGIIVEGRLKSIHREDNRITLMTFENCKVYKGAQVYFEPAWGLYDMAVGLTVTSVFGGPADRAAYGELEHFDAIKIPTRTYSNEEITLQALYTQVRNAREHFRDGKSTLKALETFCVDVIKKLDEKHPEDWLLRMELLELSYLFSNSPWQAKLIDELHVFAEKYPLLKAHILNGIQIANRLVI